MRRVVVGVRRRRVAGAVWAAITRAFMITRDTAESAAGRVVVEVRRARATPAVQVAITGAREARRSDAPRDAAP